jgi:hypothetical protein
LKTKLLAVLGATALLVGVATVAAQPTQAAVVRHKKHHHVAHKHAAMVHHKARHIVHKAA